MTLSGCTSVFVSFHRADLFSSLNVSFNVSRISYRKSTPDKHVFQNCSQLLTGSIVLPFCPATWATLLLGFPDYRSLWSGPIPFWPFFPYSSLITLTTWPTYHPPVILLFAWQLPWPPGLPPPGDITFLTSQPTPPGDVILLTSYGPFLYWAWSSPFFVLGLVQLFWHSMSGSSWPWQRSLLRCFNPTCRSAFTPVYSPQPRAVPPLIAPTSWRQSQRL